MKKLDIFKVLLVAIIFVGLILFTVPFVWTYSHSTKPEKTTESDLKIYERVREQLKINSECVFESTLSKHSEDLIFKDSSTYVSFSSDRVPGFVTIYYTRTDWKDKDYFGEKDFGVILVPEDKILGEKEDLLKWMKEYHIKKTCEKSI